MKQFRVSPRLWQILLFALTCLAAGPARAGTCSNPTGTEHDIVYNQDYHTYQFCNGTTWLSMGGGGGGSSGGLTLISTQTASASASLQFTSLPTSYNTLFLNCNGLQPVTNNTSLELQYGEGGTPTWKTSNYSYTVILATDNGPGGTGNNAAAGIILNYPGEVGNDTTKQSQNVKVWIHNITSTTLYKHVSFTGEVYDTTNAAPYDGMVGGGTYPGDTNAITAIRVLYASGNIGVGQCSLYGMN